MDEREPQAETGPEITTATVVTEEGKTYTVKLYDGKLGQEQPSFLGRRYVCGVEVDEPQPDGTSKIIVITGMGQLNGLPINFGCGTEALIIKAGEGSKYCCDKPMSVQKPKALPSSD